MNEHMRLNKKKSKRIRNRTKYFDPAICRTHIRFSSPDTYQSSSIKQEGYESRLYWQFRYCDEHNGATYFYTLTYNDEHIPTYMGKNCFDYEDLRDLLTGGFRKMLLRKYGTTFKYFIGAELGDGKGERGLHNNPHYHCLFFLEDAKNERFPYNPPTPEQFRNLVRRYWQGFDQDEDGFHDFRKAKYGIAKEGLNLGKVMDFRACMYCAKYVSKDVGLKQHEATVRRKLYFKFYKECKYDYEFHKFYYDNFLFPAHDVEVGEPRDDFAWCWTIRYLVNKYQDTLEWQKQYGIYVDKKVKEALNEYRNRYCNKCRISQGVGDYALSHIEDMSNPLIPVPAKKGFKYRPISTNYYYYRKLFTVVWKDWTGSNIRVLNDAGRQYKVSRFPDQVKKMVDKAACNLDCVLNSPELFEMMKESDVNTEVFFTYDEFLRDTNYLLDENNLQNILTRYAHYKIIYEDRYFKIDESRFGEFGYFPNIDPVVDYERFLYPSFYTTTRSNLRLDTFLDSPCEDWIPYYSHPYFLRYLRLFAVLDLCADYFFVQKDDKDQEEAEERARIKRFHDQQKLKDFYAFFER